MLAAHTSGLQGVTSGALDPLRYVDAFDAARYNRCVMALECTEIDYSRNELKGGMANLSHYVAQFQILDILSRMDVYDLPFSKDNIEIFSRLFLEDGSFPFKAGHKYLVRGGYSDCEVTGILRFEEGSDNRKVIKIRASEVEPETRSLYFTIYSPHLNFPDTESGNYTYIWDEDFNFVSGTMGTLKNYTLDMVYTDEYTRGVVPEDSLPLFAEYTGDLENFLASEEGRPWVEEIIPECQLNYESAMGLHALRQDMIFVPKASVPDAEQFEDPESPFLNSILLKNGEAEAFESYLVSKDAGGYFYPLPAGADGGHGSGMHDLRIPDGSRRTVDEKRIKKAASYIF